MIETYKGWDIRHSVYAFSRDDQLTATSPDYDVDCDQDGFFCCGGQSFTAATVEELREMIDDYIEEHTELPINQDSSS